MVFDEERQRKRTKNGAYNFSFIRKMALNFLKQDISKGSMVISINLNAGADGIKYKKGKVRHILVALHLSLFSA